jgi:hypothetical protein
MNIFDKPLNIIVPMILFIIFSPGLLFTIPDNADKPTATVVHALIFAAVYLLLRTVFAKYY